MIYFDHNATAPLLREARIAWLDAANKFPGNPSSPHRVGARAQAALDDARYRLAKILGCDPLDLVWTSGATEANNAVFHHIAQRVSRQGEVWISATEHPSIVQPARHFLSGRVRTIPVMKTGLVDLKWLQSRLVEERPELVVVMAANNETGVLQPWHEVLSLCRSRQVPYFCDATQWLGRLPGNGLGQCDLVSGSAHKFGGPKGVGFLKCPGAGSFYPLLRGGSQEEGRRAGTENVPGIWAMLAALESCEAMLRQGEHMKREIWRNQFLEKLTAKVPGCELVGSSAPRLWNTVAALMPEKDCQQRWVVKLDKLGIAVSTGSACASGREEPSQILTAMNYSVSDASRALRFSAGWRTSRIDWDSLVRALQKVRAG